MVHQHNSHGCGDEANLRHRTYHHNSTPAGSPRRPIQSTHEAQQQHIRVQHAQHQLPKSLSPSRTTTHQHLQVTAAAAGGTELEPQHTELDSNSDSSCSRRPPLASSLRWLQLCLLLLFAQDVFCFSLGYPFLPQYLAAHGHGGSGTALAFGIYGIASIATLLLLLLLSSSSAEAAQAPHSAKFWIILSSTCLAAAAGAANAALPESFPVLLATKAVQGAASALYFVQTLALLAVAYPAVYRTQAMAIVSAGLTLGDALGPVVGGLVYESQGLRQALALQPIASGLALAALLLLLAWPSRQRPWALGQQQQQQQQQRHKPWQQQRQQQHRDVECDAGPSHATLLGQAELTALLLPQTSKPAAAVAAACKRGPCLLLQLLCNQGVLSLCILALMCQAARTALDLLLPLMLQHSVQPGLIGVLFAGEAVGSVITPFAADWLLQRQSSSQNERKDQQERQERQQRQQQQQRSSRVVGSIGGRASAGSSVPDKNTGEQEQQQKEHVVFKACCEHTSQHNHLGKQHISGSCSSPATRAAAWLLFLSAAGMAVCCCLVLVAWQLPAMACQLAVQQQQQQQQGTLHPSSGQHLAYNLPGWLCPTGLEHRNGSFSSSSSSSSRGPTHQHSHTWLVNNSSNSLWVHLTARSVAAGATRVLRVRGSPLLSSGHLVYPILQSGGHYRLEDLASAASSSTAVVATDSGSSYMLAAEGASLLRGAADASAAGSAMEPAVQTPAAPAAKDASAAQPAAAVAGLPPPAAAATAAGAGPEPAGADGPEAPSLDFGVLQLLVTGLVLLLFGGCHSSCEALIYTVLTDLITINDNNANSNSSGAAVGTSTYAFLPGTADGAKMTDQVGEQCQSSSGRNHASVGDAAAGSVGGSSKPGLQQQQQRRQHDQRCVVHHHQLLQDLQHCSCDCEQHHSYNSDGCAAASGTQRVAAAVVSHSVGKCHNCHSITTATSNTDGTDASEVVMVLYVLFWVVGFTVGAAVAGLPSGSSVWQQQVTGAGMGLALGAAALWSWRGTL